MPPPDETIAVLGTGIMGTPMARNLAGAGFAVRVWNRSHQKAAELSDVATVAGTPAEACAGADAVLTMLADGDAVASAVEGEDGALAATDRSAVWIQASTVGLDAIDRLAGLAAEAGVAFVDAPVLGTKQPAEQAQLIVLASGPQELSARCGPVFDAVGSATPWLGPAGAGTRLKLVLNTWIFALVEGLAESVALAEALGVDPDRFLEAIDGGPLNASYAQIKGRMMIDRELPPSFSLRLARKDAALVRDAATGAGAQLGALEATLAQLDRAIESGHGEEDMAAAVYASLADA